MENLNNSTSTRYFHFIDGFKVRVAHDACRGCYIENHAKELPIWLDPIIQNDEIAVRQDAEFPVPGFYIIALRKHVGSIADIPPELVAMLGVTTHLVRKAMRDALGIERAHLYLEEKIIGPHYHMWILPLWDDVMKSNNIDPKIWLGNIKSYIDLFCFDKEKDKILEFNNTLREVLMGYEYIKEHFNDNGVLA